MSITEEQIATTRKFTCRLQELMAEGIMPSGVVANACIQYMGESEVEDLCRANDWLRVMGLEDTNQGQHLTFTEYHGDQHGSK